MLNKKIFILLILILAGTNWSCFWFRSAEKITADAEEEIRRSEALQNLEKMCINLPFFSETKPGEKMVIRGSMVSYDYRLNQDFNDLKAAYKNKFLGEGWTLTEEKRFTSHDVIKFEKGKLSISISKSLFRDEEYSVSCKDNSIPNEVV